MANGQCRNQGSQNFPIYGNENDKYNAAGISAYQNKL